MQIIPASGRLLLVAFVTTPLVALVVLDSKNQAPATQPMFSERVDTMKIRIKTPDNFVTATLTDNATARDFASMLPLTLTLTDYADAERISSLPRKLTTEGAPAGSEPVIGDIMYYAPWGNLAIFYKGQKYAQGLVKLGSIASGVNKLRASEPLIVIIESEKPGGR